MEQKAQTMDITEKGNRISSPSAQRISVIDALRGFALLGVILMHMLDHFGYSSAVGADHYNPTKWDSAIQWFTNMMIRGKFISIFSFLFGLSFFIQMDRAAKKGFDFRTRFLWRMLLLFLVGLVGTSFAYVDILTVYAVFGVVLVLLFPLKNRVLWLLAGLLLLGVPNWMITGLDYARFDTPVSETISTGIVSDETQISGLGQFAGQNSFLSTVKENLGVKTIEKLKFQFIHSNTGFLVLALFILGFIVGRLRFFNYVHVRKRKNLYLLAAFFLSVIVIFTVNRILPDSAADWRTVRPPGGNVPVLYLVKSSLNNLFTIAMAGTLAMGFITLYQLESVRKYLNWLTPYGRMGLTNYEAQNVTGAILFSAWGFGDFFGGKGAAFLFTLGLAIYLLQAMLSEIWIKRYLYGPLEWLWRSGTYMKRQPFKRKPDKKLKGLVLD